MIKKINKNAQQKLVYKKYDDNKNKRNDINNKRDENNKNEKKKETEYNFQLIDSQNIGNLKTKEASKFYEKIRIK